jgi:hypothetical protein
MSIDTEMYVQEYLDILNKGNKLRGEYNQNLSIQIAESLDLEMILLQEGSLDFIKNLTIEKVKDMAGDIKKSLGDVNRLKKIYKSMPKIPKEKVNDIIRKQIPGYDKCKKDTYNKLSDKIPTAARDSLSSVISITTKGNTNKSNKHIDKINNIITKKINWTKAVNYYVVDVLFAAMFALIWGPTFIFAFFKYVIVFSGMTTILLLIDEFNKEKID